MKTTIYAVDEDESIRDLYKYTFEPLGYECRTFNSAEDLFVALDKKLPNIIILEAVLPGLDGVSAVKAIRDKCNQTISVIMISSKCDEISKVRGLDAGADDYISKPFGVLELVARIKVCIRKQSAFMNECSIYEFDNIYLNGDEHIVTVDGEEVKVTLKEFYLLKMLMSRAGNVVPREVILNEVWGYEYYGKTRTLDMHIKSLRAKLSAHTNREFIQTIRGVGYKFLVD